MRWQSNVTKGTNNDVATQMHYKEYEHGKLTTRALKNITTKTKIEIADVNKFSPYHHCRESVAANVPGIWTRMIVDLFFSQAWREMRSAPV